MLFKNGSNFKEHRTTHILKTFHLSHNGKRLTRETCQQQIEMFWNVFFRRFFCDIAKRHFTKIGKISLLCEFIPFRRENTLITQFIEWQSNASNSSKKVNQSELTLLRIGERHIEKLLKQLILCRIFSNHRSILFCWLKVKIGVCTLFSFQKIKNCRNNFLVIFFATRFPIVKILAQHSKHVLVRGLAVNLYSILAVNLLRKIRKSNIFYPFCHAQFLQENKVEIPETSFDKSIIC